MITHRLLQKDIKQITLICILIQKHKQLMITIHRDQRA